MDGNATLFAGIDLSARRGLDVALLDDALSLLGLWHAPDLDAPITRLAAYGVPLVAAVDAPQAPSDFPLRRPEVRTALPVPPPAGRYLQHRICDYELVRRGIGLYLLPDAGAALPEWMAVGFTTFQRLRNELGLRLPLHAHDISATLLEAYPYAGFVTLLGGRPARKTTPQGAAARRAALATAGIRNLPDRSLTHDAADALCAAYTAWAWRHGAGCALGLPDEGLIALPIPAGALRQSYRRLYARHADVTSG